ncbi:hypothetical protein [Flavobacterium inviolabile]|uniref:hypothetical protein n=1 Tax=Flavobacterium inviolabile TaxID=2748320 RepID=UPI0015AF2EDA|nr:hypothetical protein [Flavobacterium inviolabile]
MKSLIKYFFLLTTLFLVSCGSETKKESENAVSETKSKQVELTVEFKSPVNDRFKVFYTVVPNVEITGEYMMTKYTYGSNDMQKIVFTFPVGALPYKLRLDVGENQSVDNITIKNISLDYKDIHIDGDNGEFMNQWSPNESLKYDDQNFVYNLIPVNGKKGPVFIANIELEKKLRKFRK